ncbi:MAG: hypothetical protein FWE67_07480 [Planctomycetaceae bacterium]|nr:hypothetical protein [Planctomycetaceae bacterium]
MYFFPNAADFPTAKVIINGLPWRKVFRQHAPLTPGSDEIKDGVDYLPRVSGRTTGAFGLRKKLFYGIPLQIGQVGAIIPSGDSHIVSFVLKLFGSIAFHRFLHNPRFCNTLEFRDIY